MPTISDLDKEIAELESFKENLVKNKVSNLAQITVCRDAITHTDGSIAAIDAIIQSKQSILDTVRNENKQKQAEIDAKSKTGAILPP